MYGWTGGAQIACDDAKTSDLISIVFRELQAQPDGPQFITGDLNASVPDLAALQMALEETDEDSLQAWHDIGAKADLLDSIPSEPTCKAPNAKGATRRDYVIANSVGFGLVESFQVTWDDVYVVHATIRFTLNLEPRDVEKRVVNKAKSFHDKLAEMVRAEFGYSEEDSFNKDAWERWHWHLSNVHGFMKQRFAEETETLEAFLNKGDTTTFWIICQTLLSVVLLLGLGSAMKYLSGTASSQRS